MPEGGSYLAVQHHGQHHHQPDIHSSASLSIIPEPYCSKPATMQLWMSACYWKAKQNSTSTHTATCHLTETDVMFLHKRILLQTSNTRNTRTLQETLKTNELKCQQHSGTRIVQISGYRLQDNTKTQSSLATTFTHTSQTIKRPSSKPVKLELIQPCPPA